MSEMLGDKRKKKDIIKEMIKRLHEGEDVEKLKDEFMDVIKGLTPLEIGMIEQEMIKEGVPRDEVRRLCDVHLAVFQDGLEDSAPEVEEGHPLHILMDEHRRMLEFTDKLLKVVRDMRSGGREDLVGELEHIIEHIRESESHYTREENVLFPYIEKNGITEPPAIMWSEHDRIRDIKKTLYDVMSSRPDLPDEEFLERLESTAIALGESQGSHFFKENNVLFPMALNVITSDEWTEIRHGFDDIGYCCFTPVPSKGAEEIKATHAEPHISGSEKGGVVLDTGTLSVGEVEAILNTLPVDITFVDKDDKVRYFNQTKDKIFVRTKAVLGREVRRCHPQKSIAAVEKILSDFRAGRRDVANFYINFQGRFVYIRYFPVRNSAGEYLGCLEVTQDITDIKKIEGEKRLLDD